jgi:hypothetical protein
MIDSAEEYPIKRLVAASSSATCDFAEASSD